MVDGYFHVMADPVSTCVQNNRELVPLQMPLLGLIVNGYAREVLNKLPMEFAVEAQKLLSLSLEGTVG